MVNNCLVVWREAEKGKTLIYTSFFGFAEVYKAKCGAPAEELTEDNDKKVEQVLGQNWVRPVVVDELISVAARRLMRAHPKCRKPSDGVHLATACALSVDEMHTFDKSDLLSLDGKVLRADGKALKICTPYPKLSSNPGQPDMYDDQR